MDKKPTHNTLMRASMTLALIMTCAMAWAQTREAVTYLDENGEEQQCSDYTVLTGGGVTTLAAGWYVVTDNVTYTSTITLNGDVHLILANDATLNINCDEKELSQCIYSEGSLTIYSQSLGDHMGKLIGNNNNNSSDSRTVIYSNNLTVNGGEIEATMTGNSFAVIYTKNDFNMNNGSITINGSYNGIYAYNNNFNMNNGSITVSSNSAQYAVCSSREQIYLNGGILTVNSGKIGVRKSGKSLNLCGGIVTAPAYEGNVKVGDKLVYTDNDGNYFVGTGTNTLNNTAIANKTLEPITIDNIFNDYEGNWDNGENWSSGTVPTATKNVLIYSKCNIPSGCVAQANKVFIYHDANSNYQPYDVLIIEDGGQLVCNNAVATTVQKDIEPYSVASGLGNTDGWYFIASPLSDAFTPNAVMTSNTYDLYRLNNTTWENYKTMNGENHLHFSSLENGTGYLYANSGSNYEDVTLAFTGTIKPYDASYSIPLTEGFNLVGNPYTFNAYVNRPYYRINAAGTAVEAVNNNATIAPCTGVVVDYADGQNVTFTDVPVQSQSSNGSLNIAVAQQVVARGGSSTETLDNAIVSFTEGNELGKFYFGEQNANIYIPQGTEEYAIAFSEGQGEMPLNFKAKENGTYTLTVNPEGVEMTYLHLIDNMTDADVDFLPLCKGGRGDSNTQLTYTFTAKTTDYESRFRLVFNANAASGDACEPSFAFFSNGQLVVLNEGEATLQVVDMLGRIVGSETVNGNVSKAINQPAGVYMIRLINGENVKTQKVVVR